METHSIDVHTELDLGHITLDELGNSNVRDEGRNVGDGVVDGDGSGESDT